MQDNSSTSKRKDRAVVLWGILIASAIVGTILSLSAVNVSTETAKVADATSAPINREYTIVAEEVDLEIAPGEVVRTWTFNGTMPGPTLRFTEGDNVTIHFINRTPLPHTLHFHGNHDEKNDGVIPQVMPSESYTYNFIAEPAGAFMYHCHAYPTSLHIRMGMYGAMIVDQKQPTLQPAKEFALVLSEFDPKNQDNFVAQYYPVNGYVDQYMGDNALVVDQNERVRFYVTNIGTTIPYSFHLHSTIFKVYQSGLPSNEPIDAQTIEIGPGNAVIVEASWKWPGTYLFHSHGIQEERGNMGEIHVLPDTGKIQSENESMIGWQYDLQKELQKPAIINYANLNGSTAVPSPHGDHSTAGKTVVKMLKGGWDKNQKDYYDPAEIRIEKGGTVTWVNEDTVVHTATAKDGTFDSAIMAAGQQWDNKFDKQGKYEYYCIVHPWMTGAVIVE